MGWSIFFVLIFVAVKVFGLQRTLAFIFRVFNAVPKLTAPAKSKYVTKMQVANKEQELATNVIDLVRDAIRLSFRLHDNPESHTKNTTINSDRYERGTISDKMDVVQPSGRTTAQILAEKPDFGSRRVH